MGFSISHKAVSEKKQNDGNRKENTIDKNTENFSKENDTQKKEDGENKSDEKKLPPINTDLSSRASWKERTVWLFRSWQKAKAWRNWTKTKSLDRKEPSNS